jgi:hypothetical protein
VQRREVSLASANCWGFFVFGEEERERLNAEFAEETLSSLRFGGGVAG